MSGEVNCKFQIFEAGNTEAQPFALLTHMGFAVTCVVGSELFQAEDDACILRGTSLVALLGLAVLARNRGSNWLPTDREVEDYLALVEASGS